jgi:CHAT domain-containing protein/TPR repeat protein
VIKKIIAKFGVLWQYFHSTFPQTCSRKGDSTAELQAIIEQADIAETHYLRNRGNDNLVCWEQAIKQIPLNSPELPIHLNNFGVELYERYVLTGALDDLQQAIEFCEQAVNKTAKNSPKLPNRLNNLGSGLSSRYAHKNTLKDLQRAIEYFGQAVKNTPETDSDLPVYLNSLGNALNGRYFCLRNREDLLQAIEYFEHAVKTSDEESPDLPRYLNSLANGLYYRFERMNGVPNDLQQAIEAYKLAVTKIEKNAPYLPELPQILNNLGGALYDRYALISSTFKDLQQALAAYKKAAQTSFDTAIEIKLKSSRHWMHCAFTLKNWEEVEEAYKNFVECSDYIFQNQLLRDEKETWLKESQGLAAQAAYALTKINKFKEATVAVERGLARLLSEALAYDRADLEQLKIKGYTDIYERYQQLVSQKEELMPQPVYEPPKENKQKSIIKVKKWIYHLVSSIYTIFYKPPTEVASKKREGSIRVIQQVKVHEDFRKPLEDIYENIQFAKDTLPVYSEQTMSKLRTVDKEWKNIIHDIQQIEDYKDFLKSPTFKNIQSAAAKTHIVYIIATEIGGLALIIQNDDITPIWLPEFTENELHKILNGKKVQNDYQGSPAFDKKLASQKVPFWDVSGFIIKIIGKLLQTVTPLLLREIKQNTLVEKGETLGGYFGAYIERQQNQTIWKKIIINTTHWLWQTVMSPIIDVLPKQATVTLIPVGVLGLLPLHAAWTYDNTRKTGKRYALDELTIRYAPNARALKEAYALAQQVKANKLLAIDNPSNDLPTSAPEVQSVRAMFTDSKVLSQENATKKAVLDALPDYNVLHFSCHGGTNFQKPLESCLFMANQKKITLADLLNIPLKVRLANLKVRLATLSACETGLSGTTLPDEVVSLPSGLLQAGVAGVVASLWSVSELSTMLLMSRFYYLWRQKQLEPIEALRQAQIWVRDSSYQERTAYLKKMLSSEQAKQVQKEMGFSDYSHPFHWAAFAYVGI